MVYDSNSYLNQSQMTVNAQYILDFLTGQEGWTKNAVCGLLGNAQTESTINFGIWQSLDSSNTQNGFGLLQWTPSTKYTDWASSNGYSSNHVAGELNRILYEVANNLQWISTSSYPMTFQEYTQSTENPNTLGMAFLANYERPANPDQPDRGTQAQYWYDNLTGGGSSPTPSTSSNNVVALFLSGALRGWK